MQGSIAYHIFTAILTNMVRFLLEEQGSIDSSVSETNLVFILDRELSGFLDCVLFVYVLSRDWKGNAPTLFFLARLISEQEITFQNMFDDSGHHCPISAHKEIILKLEENIQPERIGAHLDT